MISAAMVALMNAERGNTIPMDSVPSWQFSIWFEELRSFCPDKLAAPNWSKQRNALRVEPVHSLEARCSRRSPDGRGSTWYRSGGSTLAYGRCERCECPRASPELDQKPPKPRTL